MPRAKTMLDEIKGIFKSKERKALETRIQQTEEKISAMLEVLPEILKVTVIPMCRRLWQPTARQKPCLITITVTLPNGKARPAGSRQPPLTSSTDRQKDRAYSNICMRYRRGISRNRPKGRNGNPLTGIAGRKNTAQRLLAGGVIHTTIFISIYLHSA